MVRTAASAVPTKREDAGPGEAAGEDDEDERRAKKLQAMKDNVSWQAKAREDHSKVHEAREAEAAKRDAISGESGVTGGAKFLDTMHKEAFSSDATSSVEDRLARNRHYSQRTKASLEGNSFKR